MASVKAAMDARLIVHPFYGGRSLGYGRPGHAPGPTLSDLEANVSAVTSAGDRLAGDEVVEGGLGVVALGGYHLEDRLAVANFLLHGEDCALRRGLLDDCRDRHLGHRQQRVVLGGSGDVLGVG